MAGQTCALEGCSKASEHLACGELHHLLLMAGRYNAAPPHPFEAIRERSGRGLCALPSCSKAPWPGHPWCSKTHYLSWLSTFYTSLSPLQICKLPGCTRHVYVFDTANTPPSEFCGWRHRQKFEMLNALHRQHHNRPPSPERDCDHVPSMKSIMHECKHLALHGVTPKSIKVDSEFFTKHPWEVLAEDDSCSLIAQCKFTWRRKRKQRDMVTKDHYHWKQQGQPKPKNGYCKKYFSYRKLKGKEEVANLYHDESVYTMKEYIMDGADLYSVVKIFKGRKKLRRVGKSRKREGDSGCSQGSAISQLDCSSEYQFIETLEELFFAEGCLED